MPSEDSHQPLFAHSKRPRWGFAILAREEPEQRHYQFQDGQLRTFKQGYYELLEPVAPPRALDIVRDLKAMIRVARRELSPAAKVKRRTGGFEERLAVFLGLHPNGFTDPAWVAERRGVGTKRKKRHRDPAIADARERLSAEALDALIEAGSFDAVVKTAREVLGATDVAGSKDLGPLRKLAPEDHEDFARALRALLWGDGEYPDRLAAYIDVLARTEGERVTWPLASALSALVHPTEYALVKPSVVRREAQWSAPSLPYDASPSAELYARIHTMIVSVQDRLERAGHPASDLFDVTDFLGLPLTKRASAAEPAATPAPEPTEQPTVEAPAS